MAKKWSAKQKAAYRAKMSGKAVKSSSASKYVAKSAYQNVRSAEPTYQYYSAGGAAAPDHAATGGYLDPGTMIQWIDGTWHQAGNLGRLFGWQTDASGDVKVDGNFTLKLADGKTTRVSNLVQAEPFRSSPQGGTTVQVPGTAPGGAKGPVVDDETEPEPTPTPYEKWLQEQEALRKDGEMRGAKANLEKFLDEVGLGSLAKDAWKQIKGGKVESEVMQWIRDTKEYKDRFRGNEIARERLKKGLPANVLTEKQYIEYEAEAARRMQLSGLPRSFWDNQQDFHKLIGFGVSVNELQDRIDRGWMKVTQAPAEVLRAFEKMFGHKGAQNLAAYFLDPDRTEVMWSKDVAKATAKGYADIAGLSDFRYGDTDRVAAFTRDTDEIRRGISQLSQYKNLFRETISETEDFSSGDEGVDAVFGGDDEKLTKRKKDRVAAFSGGGGAYLGGEGQTGFGRAD